MYLNSPFNPPSFHVAAEVEAMLSDTSGQMAKSQLQRQVSNTSSAARRGLSRVTKPTSAGNSPQPFQRRRATTQTVPKQRTSLYQQCLQIPQVSEASQRPVSWHPSTLIGMQQQQQQQYHQQQHTDYAIPYQPSHTSSSGFNGFSDYTSRIASNGNDMSSSWQYQVNLSSLYEPSKDYDVHGSANLGLGSTQSDYFGRSYSLYSSPLEQTSEGYPVFSPVPYPSSAWTSSLSNFSNQTAPLTPHSIPNPDSTQTWQEKSSHELILPKKESKELIGMGLHDGPDRNSWSLESMLGESTNLFNSHRPESMGKGLKLEETWEPPEEDEDESDSEEQDEEDGQEARVEQDNGDDEILRLAESALGIGQASGHQSHQQLANAPNRSMYMDCTPFGASDMWQGEIADYCVR